MTRLGEPLVPHERPTGTAKLLSIRVAEPAAPLPSVGSQLLQEKPSTSAGLYPVKVCSRPLCPSWHLMSFSGPFWESYYRSAFWTLQAVPLKRQKWEGQKGETKDRVVYPQGGVVFAAKRHGVRDITASIIRTDPTNFTPLTMLTVEFKLRMVP